MIALKPDDCAVFVREGFWKGLSALAERQADKASKALEDADPEKLAEIYRAQERIRIWRKDIPSIQKAVEEYESAARLAATSPSNG